MGLHEHKVCFHAWADESTVRHLKTTRHAVRHQVCHLVDRQQAFMNEVQHGHKSVLHKRSA